MSFKSYEVEGPETLASGIIEFDIDVIPSTVPDPNILIYPAIVIYFNDDENNLHHYFMDNDFYVPVNAAGEISANVSPSYAPSPGCWMYYDEELSIPIFPSCYVGGEPGQHPEWIPMTRNNLRIKVYPEREDQNVHVDNYPITTWSVTLLQALPEAPGLGDCSRFPIDIMDQCTAEPFSMTHATNIFLQVVCDKLSSNPAFYEPIPITCFDDPPGVVYICDVHDFNNQLQFNLSTYDFNPFFNCLAGTILNNSSGTPALTPGVHHILLEARVRFDSDQGEVFYNLYDDLEVEVMADNAGQNAFQGFYNVYYLSDVPGNKSRIYTTQVAIPEAQSPIVSDYATPVWEEYVDLADYLPYSSDQIVVENISTSDQGRYVAVQVKINDSFNPVERQVYVLDYGDIYGIPPILLRIDADAYNWFIAGDGLYGAYVQEMNPQLSKPFNELPGQNSLCVVFEGAIRGAGYMHKRAFAAIINLNSFTIVDEVFELRFEALDPWLEGQHASETTRLNYNTYEPSVGGPRQFTFVSDISPDPLHTYLVSYTSTLSFEEDGFFIQPAYTPPPPLIPEVEVPPYFSKGESHVNFAFILWDSWTQPPEENPIYMLYGFYGDEGNIRHDIIGNYSDHQAPNCMKSYINDEATFMCYLSTIGSDNLPFYTEIPDLLNDDFTCKGIGDEYWGGPYWAVWVCWSIPTVACELPKEEAHGPQSFWYPQISDTYLIDSDTVFNGVMRENMGLESEIAVFEENLSVFDPCDPELDEPFYLDSICSFEYAHEDLPSLSGDGSAIVYTSHEFDPGDIYMFFYPVPTIADGGYKCIRLTESGLYTRPVISNFVEF